MSDYSLLVETMRYAGARQPSFLDRESHGTKLRPQTPARSHISRYPVRTAERLSGQPRRTAAILLAPEKENFRSVLHPGFS